MNIKARAKDVVKYEAFGDAGGVIEELVSQLENVEAERDAALAAIERVQETLSLHNPNGRLVKEVLAALDGAPEGESK